MESTEELGYLGRNPLYSHLHAAVLIGLPPDGVSGGDGLPWLESRLKPKTAAMDRMGIWRTYFHNSFNNSMRPFCNTV
jgi:hypothetical protein